MVANGASSTVCNAPLATVTTLLDGKVFLYVPSASGRIPRAPDSPDNLECVLPWGTTNGHTPQ